MAFDLERHRAISFGEEDAITPLEMKLRRPLFLRKRR